MTPHTRACMIAYLRTDSCTLSARCHQVVNRAADLHVLILKGK
jgi:hypothetical protein